MPGCVSHKTSFQTKPWEMKFFSEKLKGGLWRAKQPHEVLLQFI